MIVVVKRIENRKRHMSLENFTDDILTNENNSNTLDS